LRARFDLPGAFKFGKNLKILLGTGSNYFQTLPPPLVGAADMQCAARAKPPPCQTCGWKLENKLKQDDENMLENGVEIRVKCLNSSSSGGLELLGDPPGYLYLNIFKTICR